MAEVQLKRSISFSVLVLLAINAIIGTGIFFVPGIAAKIAGPASLVSWIGVSIIALVVAACFAELVGMFPKSGGVYEYTKQSFGEFGGFMVGWTSWLVANVTIAMLAIGSLEYLGIFIQFSLVQKTALALLTVILINIVSFRGIDLSVKMLLFFAFATILSLWTLMSWGVYYFDVTAIHFLDIFPKVSLVIAMLYVLETFFGWETVSYLAEETKDAHKVIPKVMMFGTVGVIILAVGVVTVSLGSVHWEVLANSTSPLTEVAKVIMGETGAKIMAILIFLNIFGGAAAWIITAPRLVFALARDGLLPKVLSKVHPKYQTPYMAIIAQAVLSSIILLTGSYKLLLELVLPLAIFMYAMVIVSVTILRFTKPEVPRTFKIPFGKVLPLAVASILVFLVGAIEYTTILTAGMFVLIGIPLYILNRMETKPEIVKNLVGWSSGLQKVTYKFIGGKHHKYILSYFRGLENGIILNMGCNVGELSKDLAKFTSPKGRVIATEISKKDLKRANKLAEKHKIRNIHFVLEDPQNRHNIHQNIRQVQGVTSIGLLGYLIEPEKVFYELNKRILISGRIYFVEYDRVFKFMRAKEWLRTDEEIIQTFAKYGFRVKIRRVKGLLWDSIHIAGWKAQHVK